MLTNQRKEQVASSDTLLMPSLSCQGLYDYLNFMQNKTNLLLDSITNKSPYFFVIKTKESDFNHQHIQEISHDCNLSFRLS